MVDFNEFHRELADLHLIPGQDGVQLDAAHPVLPELEVDEGEGQPGAPDGGGHLPQDIRGRADMVFVAVGEYITAHAVFVGDEIGCIGDHQVNAQHILLGENGAAVHHQNVILVFKSGHILADFIYTAQGDDSQLRALRHMPPPFK